MTLSQPRVMGLDLSITHTAVATNTGVALTIPGRSDRGDLRLDDIYSAIRIIATSHDLAVIEDLPHSGRQAGVTGMVQGVVRMALLRADVRYAFVSPATLKVFATGNGGGKSKESKARMRTAWLELYADRYPGVDPDDDNQVDAAWLRIAGLHKLGLDATLEERAHRLDTGKWKNWEYLL